MNISKCRFFTTQNKVKMYRKVTKLVMSGADSGKNVKKRYKWHLYDQPRVSGRFKWV